MTPTPGVDRRAAGRYASAVARHLRHLPRAQRRRLVADVRTHLLELPVGQLEERLGPPRTYAAELLRSSGLPEPHGFRHWLRRVPLLWKIAASLLLLLAVAGTVAGIWVNGYEPLATGGASFTPGILPDPDLGEHANVLVDYQHDARYQFGFSIVNNGRFAVDIVDFPLADDETFPFVVEQVLVDPPHRYGDPDATPFHPFTLQPGEDRGFTFRGVLAHCDSWEHGSTAALESVAVEFRFFGITKTHGIPLWRPIAMRMPGPATSQCPDPSAMHDGPLNGNGTQVLSVLHGGDGFDIQFISSHAPDGPLRNAEWTPPSPCDDTPPAGFTAVPVDIVAGRRQDPLVNRSPFPVELRFALPQGSSGGRFLVADSSHRCRPADSVHIETLDEGDITLMHGIVEVPAGTCGARQIEVATREGDAWRSAGGARLDIDCPASG